MRFSAAREMRINLGLLFLRVGLGVVFIIHGYPKLFGGPEQWSNVGGAMSNLGIDSFHPVFGFMAGFAEFFGGIFLIFGLLTSPALILLIGTMIVALITQFAREAGFPGIAHPLSVGLVFIALFITGPGRFSIDHQYRNR